MWVRGLKQKVLAQDDHKVVVAPYVGAWIETLSTNLFTRTQPVAPYVGAWIETNVLMRLQPLRQSHPMWVRGLKHDYSDLDEMKEGRTLCGCVD